MFRQAIYGIGHLITRTALLKPLRNRTLTHSAYAQLYGGAKHILERPEHRFFQKNLFPGMTIFDVGAHTGHYSALFSTLVGAQGRVYSFEPDTWSFSALRNHLQHRSNVQQMPLALGSVIQKTSFYPNAQSRANSSLLRRTHSEEPITVDMTTIDSFCSQQGIKQIDALKIDTEGAETAVLHGAETLLKEHPPLWIMVELFPEILQKAGTSTSELCAILLQSNYLLNSLSSDGSCLPIADIDAFMLGCSSGYANIVAFHRHSQIKGVRSASRPPNASFL